MDFDIDLTGHEVTRRAAIMEAVGDTYDPGMILSDETLSWDMLYSNLDDEQQRIYDHLVEAGVLPHAPTRS